MSPEITAMFSSAWPSILGAGAAYMAIRVDLAVMKSQIQNNTEELKDVRARANAAYDRAHNNGK